MSRIPDLFIDSDTDVDIDYNEIGNGTPATSVGQPGRSTKEADTQPGRAVKRVSFADERSQAQRKRTDAQTCSFDGPIVDVALVACGLSSTLFFSKNAASRSSADLKSPLYQSLPLNVKYVVDIQRDLTSFAAANGTDVAKYGDLVALVNDLKSQNCRLLHFESPQWS